MGSELRPLFSWIHLSDLHFGHGDTHHRWDQQLVLDELSQDIPQAIARFGIPAPCAVLVTGDIAFSGASRSADEYESATAFLHSIAAATQLSPAQIFVVPGNHDVQRSADKTPAVGRLMRSLRDGNEQIDAIIDSQEERGILAQRQANYQRFASQFAPACLTHERAATLQWSHRLESAGLPVRLIGLNTAMLAADDSDKGKLRLGLSGFASSVLKPPLSPNELVLVLSHHPLHGGWLADESDVDGWLRKRAHVHLFGHIHSADTESLRRGGQREFVRITAGAAHNERLPPGNPAGHGYSFGAVLAGDDGAAVLRVWPRLWTDDNREFRVDVRMLKDGQSAADHKLGLKLLPRARQPTGSTAGSTQSAAQTDSASAHSDEARRARLVKLLGLVLPFDSDLDMLCFTYFPDVMARFTQGMDRTQKHLILLTSASPTRLLTILKEYSPERFVSFADPADREP